MEMPESQELAAQVEEKSLEMIGVRSRIPQFWRDKPRLWFAQLETILVSQRLSDDNKFALVVAQLEKNDVEQISDIILSPPSTGKYESLKQRLLSVYEESEESQLNKLLNEIDLGEQRPSQLLRRMKDLARNKVPDDTLKILWMGHLPRATRAVLSVSTETGLETLAIMADKMHEQSREINSVCTCQNHISTSKQPPPPPCASSSNELIAMIDALTKEVAYLRADVSKNRNQTFQGRSRTRSNSVPRRREGDIICYFHRKFGRSAYRCKSPCNYHMQRNGNQERSGN